MIYAVEFRLPRGSQGLMIFTAEDENQAADYVAQMIVKHGHTYASDPMPLVNGLDDLYRLFSRPFIPEVVSGHPRHGARCERGRQK
jgi:hypothetical protein